MDGRGRERLRDRLIGRYPTPDSLSEFVFYQLGVRLDHITTADGMPAKGYHVVEWFDAKGRLGELEAVLGPDLLASGRVWLPAVLYPLQPAPHFAGRESLLAELRRWVTDPADPNRVVALVAAGGTGKTALAERVLASLKDYTAAGVFVWSFYENPRSEAFLRAACEYILGNAPRETGGLLEHLQRGLTGAALHLFIMDGLELVQAPGTTGRLRGELEEPLMKRFLRWLAAGLGTKTKALITSRFPVPDLADWRERGFRPIDLADLDTSAARAVLRKWGVRGTDAALDGLAESVHRHALTVDVLGSYLGTFHGGDPAAAPSFDPQFLADTDAKTAKLHRVLTSYAEKLPARERDLLARLSVFPRGVGVDVIGYLIDAGGEVAATLVGCGQDELLKLLERLRGLGLVFRYDAGGVLTFTAHPFLRGFFEKLLGVDDPKQIHEAVRMRLAAGLEERPEKKPTDPADLDRYERLIEVTRLAGKTQKALYLFWVGLGGYGHLGGVLGDNARGLRIVSTFATDGTPTMAGFSLPDSDRALLVVAWGLFAQNLGDLSIARRAFEIQLAIRQDLGNQASISTALQNLANIELQAGLWVEARATASKAIEYADQAGDERGQQFSHGWCACALAGLGMVADARHHFAEATSREDEPMLYALRGVTEAEFKLATGNAAAARTQAEANRIICGRNNWPADCARCDTLLGRCALPDDSVGARSYLAAARDYAGRSGDAEVTLCCYQLAAEIARHERDFPCAVAEAEAGIQLADSCGFGRWSLDIRTELAQIHLAAGRPRDAIEPAEWVLRRSQEADCQYAWGIADSLHWLGVAHARLSDTAKARDYLTRATEKRKPLEHPGLKETEDELRKLGG
jgi:tetratricopeptide (TPR) repeat protein